jgi:hypothetical protein
MLVTADEVVRSLRGTMRLLNRRMDGLNAFDMSERGFWHSFAAIWLTLPAFIVALALERQRLGRLGSGSPLLEIDWLTFVVAFGHVATFLALPLGMIAVTRRLGLGERYVPFVVVTNWILALALTALSLPAALLLLGWARPSHAVLFTLAFGVVIFRLQWFATKATLGVSGSLAAVIVLYGVALDLAIAGAVDVLTD